LERYLLLAGDLPGLKLSTTLKPSEKEVGASTLVVEVTEKPLDVSARVDNRGTKARGPIQYLGSVTLNNVFGQHESLGVSYASVPRSKELKYVGLNYRHVLTNEGLTAFANGSYSWGRPGTAQLEQFDFATRSTLVEVGLAYPFVRTRERNLTLSGLAFMSDSNADVLREPYNVDRLRGVRVKLDADNADSSQGINQLNITFSQGFEGLGGTSNDNPLASRAAGRVDFAKLEGSWSRTQGLLGNFSAHLAIYGQYAFTSLLASEQCGYGGRFFGRAYDPSQLLGDHCWQGVAELRYDLPVAQGVLSQVQLYGFTDYGKLYTIVPSEGTAPTIQGASAGAGVRLAWGNFLNIDLTTARAIEGPRDDWRFFFTAVARY
jgi:hemolysin activation/secretion protein